MLRSLALAALIGLSGCAGTVGDWAHGRHPQCDVRRLHRYVGRIVTPDRVRHMEWTSRATQARTLRANVPVTPDVQADRLTVVIDSGNRITALRCG